MVLTPQIVWRIFVSTGSINAYLLYRQLLELTKPALN
ncbi:MAG: YqzL family protein [Firmicutes bacterium]|jgi:hypothetical protein|nr:YqzL family protein [Bacillota bacterium]NLO66066.1 YqzL family protein [Bacillota bacterium]